MMAPSDSTSVFAERLQELQQVFDRSAWSESRSLALALAQDAQHAGDEGPAAQASIVAACASYNLNEFEQALQQARRAIASTQQARSAHQEATAWSVVASATAALGQTSDCIRATQAAMALIDSGAPVQSRSFVWMSVCLAYDSIGLPLRAYELSQAAEADIPLLRPAARLRLWTNQLIHAMKAWDQMHATNPALAQQLLDHAHATVAVIDAQALPDASPGVRAMVAAAVGRVRRRAGQPEAARLLLEEAVQAGASQSVPEQRVNLFELACALGALGMSGPARACVQRARALRPPPGAAQRVFDHWVSSELARLDDDLREALAALRRFHGRVMRSERALFDARLAEATERHEREHLRRAVMQGANGAGGDEPARNTAPDADANARAAGGGGAASPGGQTTRLLPDPALRAVFERLRADPPLTLVLWPCAQTASAGSRVDPPDSAAAGHGPRGADVCGRDDAGRLLMLLPRTTLAQAQAVVARLRLQGWPGTSAGDARFVEVHPSESLAQAAARAAGTDAAAGQAVAPTDASFDAGRLRPVDPP